MFLKLHDGSLISLQSITRVSVNDQLMGMPYDMGQVETPTKFDLQVFDGQWHVLDVYNSREAAEAKMLELFNPMNA